MGRGKKFEDSLIVVKIVPLRSGFGTRGNSAYGSGQTIGSRVTLVYLQQVPRPPPVEPSPADLARQRDLFDQDSSASGSLVSTWEELDSGVGSPHANPGSGTWFNPYLDHITHGFLSF